MKYQKVKRAFLCLGGAMAVAAPVVAHSRASVLLAAPQSGLISREAIVVNPATDTAYAVDTDRNAVSVIHGETHPALTVRVGKDPVAIAVNPVTNRIYVANHGDGTVSVLDGKTNALLATINVGSLPYVVAVDPATNRVYVSNVFSDVLTIIDGTTDAARTMKAGSADAIIIDLQLNNVFLLHYETASLTLLDARNDSMRHVPVGKMHLWGAALDTPTKTLYVTRIGNADLVAIDENSQAVTVIPAGKLPCAVAVNPVTDTAYVVNMETTL
jgi:YVTN family beta-propeller protein